MVSINLQKRGAAAVGLIVAGLGSAFGCDGAPAPDGGTGGGGSGGGNSGGGTGGTQVVATGGVQQGTGGLGTGGACQDGVGGAVYLYDCAEWLGERPGAPVDFSCGEGGDGGDGGQGGQGGLGPNAPALARVCSAESNPDFNGAHPVHFCLAELTGDVCSASHEADVLACLSLDAPCNAFSGPKSDCVTLQTQCNTLSFDTCYWAMTSAQNPEHIESCFSQPVDGELCDERFMRCAWNL